MECAFHVGYQDGDKVFYVSPTSQQGHEESFHDHKAKWDWHWKVKNQEFEDIFLADHDFQMSLNKMFFIWDGNHCL